MPDSPTQLAGGTRAQWLSSSLILLDRQLGVCRNPDGTAEVRVGDGLHRFFDLPYTDPVAVSVLVGGLLDGSGLVKASKVQPAVRSRTGAKPVGQGEQVIDPRDYGAAGDGVRDDTVEVLAAFSAARALMRTGLGASIHHPGATVVMRGTFNLASLNAPIEVSSNVDAATASLVIPNTYAGTVLLVGHGTSGHILQSATITLPDVVKLFTAGIIAGSTGVVVQNLYSSALKLGRVAYFETGVWFTGLGEGLVYNTVHLGWVSYCKVALQLKPKTGGWVNQNVFNAGGVQQSPGAFGGGYNRTGWRHLVMDGAGINGINGNTFVGVSFEGDVSDIAFSIRQAVQNTFIGCRSEPGRQGRGVSASGATLTTTAHGLAIGDMVIFGGGVATGGFVNVPYYVVSTPTADTYTVSAAKSGTAITFTSAGSGMAMSRPHRVLVDATTYSTGELHFVDTIATLKTLELVVAGGLVDGITQENSAQSSRDPYSEADLPVFRGRNRYPSAATRPIFAAYPATVRPDEDPQGWTAALSDRGLLFGAGRVETGRLFASSGVLNYKRPADTASFEIATAIRSATLLAITSLSVPANSTTTVNVALPNVSVNDHVLVTPADILPAGIVLSHGRCSVAGQVQVTLGNLTPSAVSVTANVQVVAFRRFF